MVAAAPPEEGVFRDGAFCITVEKMIALLSSTVSTPRPATCDSLELSLSKTSLANPSEEVLQVKKENLRRKQRVGIDCNDGKMRKPPQADFQAGNMLTFAE